MTLRRSRRLVAASTTVLVTATAALTVAFASPSLAAPAGPAPAPVSDRFAAPPIEWGQCDPDDFPTLAEDGSSLVPATYRCATYQVPLRYDRPDGEQISLALIMRPADDPAARKGSIFTNPGGPGGSGVDLVSTGGEGLFGPEVLAAFDLVGFDPRGIARSTTLQCYADNEALIEDLETNEFQAVWPETDAEYAAARRDGRDLARDCRRNAGRIIDHMGTTNVARDMDVLRRAVGDPELNFIGYSYGTYLCAQYITQYADRVGAVVCDANLDPVEWATGERRDEGRTVPLTARIGSEVGTNASLEEFFRLCDEGGPERCAFAPNAKGRFEALYDTLSTTPLELGGPTPFDEQFLVARSNGPLYNSLFGYPFLAGLFAELELRVAGTVPEPVEPEPSPVVPPVNEAYLNVEGFYGVACSDNTRPNRISAWRRAIERGEGVFGPFWASNDLPCLSWPATDRDTILGPFDRATSNPVLFVNTRFDPATPYEDAVDARRRLPNSALLTVEGWGHVGRGLSRCGIDIVDRYMLTRTVPSPELTCTQDITPFSPESQPPTPDKASADAGQIPEPVLDDAVDAVLADIAAGDPESADSNAAQVVIDGLEDAGRTELADTIRTQEAILEQARIGLTALR